MQVHLNVEPTSRAERSGNDASGNSNDHALHGFERDEIIGSIDLDISYVQIEDRTFAIIFSHVFRDIHEFYHDLSTLIIFFFFFFLCIFYLAR